MSRESAAPSAMPTLEDVARAAGVSRATVSRVVNGIRNVDPAIQQAVRDAVAATGYTPNRAARSLVTRRAETIALVVSGAGDASEEEQNAFASGVFADPFFGRVAAGVVGYLRPRSMHPVLMFAETSAARAQVVSYLRQGSADGALIVSTHAEDPLPGMIAAAGLPAVLFARPAEAVPISYVDLAHQDGAALAADHLLARGWAAGDDRGPPGRARRTPAAGRVPGVHVPAGPPVRTGRRGRLHAAQRGRGDGPAAGRTPGPRRGVRGQRPDGAGRVPGTAGARQAGPRRRRRGRLRRQLGGGGLPPR